MATWNISLKALFGVLIITMLLAVSGCGGSDGGNSSTILAPPSSSTPPPATQPPPADEEEPPPSGDTTVTNRITGSVGDGPITGATLRVRNNRNQVLEETQSSATADYSVTVKTQGNQYSLTVEAFGGTDIVSQRAPDFRLYSAITNPRNNTVSNLNPYGTLIFGAAQKSGGLSSSTISAATDNVMNRYGFGLDKNIIPDPVGTPIDESNIHVIVKTSETLGEMVRRTRDALYASGGNRDGDGIMAALSADLSDGWIDGKGASGHDARVAAVANVATAAVMVEAMANRLHVYDVNATRAMDDAIRQVRPNAPASHNTANVAIPASALQQTIRALEATRVLSDDARILETIQVLQTTAPGTLPAQLASRLPAGIDKVLADATLSAAYSDDTQQAQINTIATSQGSALPGDEPEPPPADEPEPPPADEPEPPPADEPAPPPANNPPVISGTPTTTVQVGEAWSFRPTASDADGDKLTFSISNKPAWMSFDSATGRAWGTPSDAHVGTHLHIVISVTDGQATTSLDPFDVTVEALPPPVLGTATVSWMVPTVRTDGSVLTGLKGYKVYYGTDPTSLTHIVDITDPDQTHHVIENLDEGTWYFAVTAYDDQGLEGAMSNIASKTIS